MKSKIYINSIPFYKVDDKSEDSIKYILFEDDDNGNVIYISRNNSEGEQCEILMEIIREISLTDPIRITDAYI